MSWNLEGHKVAGKYLDQFSFIGVVVESRVKYGGKVCNTIVLDTPIVVFGEFRTRVLMDSDQISQVFVDKVPVPGIINA
jgi:hypothetical protein